MSQSDGRLPSEEVPFKSVQIIVAALILGTLTFAVIALLTAQPGNLDLVAYLAVGSSGRRVGDQFHRPADRHASKDAGASAGKQRDTGAWPLFRVYQTQAIIRGALLEGERPSFVALPI